MEWFLNWWKVKFLNFCISYPSSLLMRWPVCFARTVLLMATHHIVGRKSRSEWSWRWGRGRRGRRRWHGRGWKLWRIRFWIRWKRYLHFGTRTKIHLGTCLKHDRKVLTFSTSSLMKTAFITADLWCPSRLMFLP